MELMMMSETARKHFDFWSGIIKQLRLKKTAREEFVACAIGDWLWDINPNSNAGLGADIISNNWNGVGKYNEWLLMTMDKKDKLINCYGNYFDKHEKEIMALLGNNDIKYIDDFSAEIYYEKLAGMVF